MVEKIDKNGSLPFCSAFLWAGKHKSDSSMKHIYFSILIVMLSCVMSHAQNSKAGLKGRQPANQQPYCTPEGCQVGDTDAVTASTEANPNKILSFRLFDVYGRQVDSADYAGLPVLLFFGSCWCGGCQSDAEPFPQLAEEYAGKGLVCIRTVAGDNELAALDFQNHFRLPMVQLMDPDRAFEKRYNRDGWTFLMLCDRQGRVVYTIQSQEGDEQHQFQTAKNLSADTTTKLLLAYRNGDADWKKLADWKPM